MKQPIQLNSGLVTLGLDPGVQRADARLVVGVDPRVKPGGDEFWQEPR